MLPSLREGFGLPVLEAMACGTPVITSSSSSLPEVGGDAAIRVDPYDTIDLSDAMYRVLADADSRGAPRARPQVGRRIQLGRTAEQMSRLLDDVRSGGSVRCRGCRWTRQSALSRRDILRAIAAHPAVIAEASELTDASRAGTPRRGTSMTGVPEINVEAIMAQIRESIARRRAAGELFETPWS